MEEELPIDIGIRMEGDSIKFYSERSAEVENPIARRMLESFVEDEKKHLKDLLAMKSKSNLSKADRPEETIIVTRAKNAFEEVPDDVRNSCTRSTIRSSSHRAVLRNTCNDRGGISAFSAIGSALFRCRSECCPST